MLALIALPNLSGLSSLRLKAVYRLRYFLFLKYKICLSHIFQQAVVVSNQV